MLISLSNLCLIKVPSRQGCNHTYFMIQVLSFHKPLKHWNISHRNLTRSKAFGSSILGCCGFTSQRIGTCKISLNYAIVHQKPWWSCRLSGQVHIFLQELSKYSYACIKNVKDLLDILFKQGSQMSFP